MTSRHRLAASVATVAVLIVSASGCGDDSGDAAISGDPPPTALSAHGKRLWNFEALLTETFRRRPVAVSDENDFSCAGTCAPLSRFRPYRFTFAMPRGTRFHTSSKNLENASFGNYPVLIRVRGRPVACDEREQKFLIRYANMASFTVDCLAPL